MIHRDTPGLLQVCFRADFFYFRRFVIKKPARPSLRGAPPQTKTRINHMIRVPVLRVIGAEGEQLGIISLDEALRQAREAELDLVEVAPMADPPVAKIMDFGKFKYQQEKKAKESKKKTHSVSIKEIKLRPKIGQNDLDVKRKQATEFLGEGNKVKVTMQFRGREMAYTELGKKVLDQLLLDLKDIAIPDMEAKLEGKSMGLMLSPKKTSKPAEEKSED